MKELHKNSYKRLSPEMRKFIEEGVKKLGSIEAVERHWSKEYTTTLDLVERYSRSVAKRLFKETKI
jgi:hypothetical protein